MPHALARWRGDPGNVGDDGFAHEAPDIARGGFLIASTDLTDKDDALGARIAFEEFEHVDEVHTAHRIPTNPYTGALAEPDVGRLKHGLVGECPRARDDADPSLLVDESGHGSRSTGPRYP